MIASESTNCLMYLFLFESAVRGVREISIGDQGMLKSVLNVVTAFKKGCSVVNLRLKML